jgi:transcriptional regulator GlxA family with amidase domain
MSVGAASIWRLAYAMPSAWVPRSFRRLLRFQTLMGLIRAAAGQPNWAALALEAGYYDQSHMIREFGEFSGLTPGMYLARALPEGGGLVET